jgi:mono/diheme cytochrome c family protein
MLRWLRRLLLALFVLLVVAVAALYGASEWAIRRARTAPHSDIAVASSPAAVAEGARLGRLFGCASCHGADGRGSTVMEDPMFGTIVAPGYASVAAQYSDADLARAIRQGVRKDGTAIYVMPSERYVRLADSDVAAMIAWMRSLDPSGDATGQTSLGPLGRLMLVTHLLHGGAQDELLSSPNRPPDDGGYLVQAVCSECHRLRVPGATPNSNEVPPPLAPAAAAYDDAAFRQLLRSGQGQGSANLGSMSEIARSRLSAMSDDEIAAVHAYLKQAAQHSD